VTAPLDGAPSTCVGIVYAGQMGAGLGWALREGGARVVTTVAGRSSRTERLAAAAGLELLPDIDAVVAAARVVLLVTPPAAAVETAHAIGAAARRVGASPLAADLNAIAPSTVDDVASALAPLELVDGSISGAPPNERPGARIYLSGPRAAEVAALPWRHVTPIVVGDLPGSASAVKMCTASVYKGLSGLFTQALRTAAHHGVLDRVLDDLRTGGFDRVVPSVTVAATKSARYVGEMHQIAETQGAAGLPAALFEAYARVWAEVAESQLARDDPESVDRALPAAEVVARLARPTESRAGRPTSTNG
jgi:3-hydroxyisobutyrate dehydrogenase-like beta-hydroxyacid dehydrogenase